MNSAPPDPPTPEQDLARRRVRFELVFASVWLAIGLFALPAVVFAVGTALLGPYGENSGLMRFYADFFADLAEPSARAWTLALGPLGLISLVRLIFVGTTPRAAEPPAAAPEPERRPLAIEEPRRIEPRVGLD